jgi:hypothetical protein
MLSEVAMRREGFCQNEALYKSWQDAVATATKSAAWAAAAVCPVSSTMDVVGSSNAQSRRLEWRAAERRRRDVAGVAVVEEGLRRVGLRSGGRACRGEMEAGDRRWIFDLGK